MNICHLHSYTSDERMIYFCRGSDFLKIKNKLPWLGGIQNNSAVSILNSHRTSPHKYMMIISASIVKKVPFFHITRQEMLLHVFCTISQLETEPQFVFRSLVTELASENSASSRSLQKSLRFGGVDLDWCCGTPWPFPGGIWPLVMCDWTNCRQLVMTSYILSM